MTAQRLLYLLFLAVAFNLVACSNVKRIEVKNEEGQLTEQYSVDKKTGLKQGVYCSFMSGAKFDEVNYVDGKMEGERKIFRADGSVEAIETYLNDQFQGPYKSFNEAGQIRLVGSYDKGKAIGEWKRYYDNGQLMENVSMKDNLENGPFVEYYENGKLKAEGNYLNGDHEHGLLKMYNEDGELVKTMNCEKGICRTSWTKESGEPLPENVKNE